MQILEAAFDCFAERGYHATSMDDLVRASGLSKGSLYWHFDSKEDVFLALFDHTLEGYFDRWSDVNAADASILDIIDAGGRLAIEAFEEDRKLIRTWVEFIAHPAIQQRIAVAYDVSRKELASLLETGIERGELRPFAAMDVAATLIGTMEGILLQASVDPSFDPAWGWPSSMDILRRGLES